MRCARAHGLVGLAACAMVAPQLAIGQCGAAGPDAIIGSIDTTVNFTASGDFEAFGVGATICNVGDTPFEYRGGFLHPILSQQAYRLSNRNGITAIEQVGASWVFGAFFPLQTSLCCTCAPGTSTTLGAGCSSAESASVMANQATLIPRSTVNASGGFSSPVTANPPYSGSVARRLQIPIAELAPSNETNRYIVEAQVFITEEATSGLRFNNVSTRLVNATGTGSNWNFAASESTQRSKPAIQWWREYDPGVTEMSVVVPNSVPSGPVGGEGMFIVSSRATEIDAHTWHYEFAVYNMNSDRGGREFRVPVPSGAVVSNVGFHDVAYHDGDGVNDATIDGTDWVAVRDDEFLTWSTSTFAENPNANAIRWGTLYNFRFDANMPPALGVVDIGLFKLPMVSPGVVTVYAQVPQSSGCQECLADYDRDGGVTGADLAAFFSDYEAGAACADVDQDGGVTGADVSSFFAAFESGSCEPR